MSDKKLLFTEQWKETGFVIKNTFYGNYRQKKGEKQKKIVLKLEKRFFLLISFEKYKEYVYNVKEYAENE